MFLSTAVSSGDLLPWVIYLVGCSMALALVKFIMTLGRIARLEVWARFTDRHRNANNKVQKLIERSCRDDLQSRHLEVPWRHPADISK